MDELTLFKRTRTMMGATNLDKKLLVETINIVYYAGNQAPSTVIKLKIPIEMWIDKPVNNSTLLIFGNHVYMMYNAQETTKLDPKSRKCLILGYVKGAKGNRLWNPTGHKVVISRDVIFI